MKEKHFRKHFSGHRKCKTCGIVCYGFYCVIHSPYRSRTGRGSVGRSRKYYSDKRAKKISNMQKQIKKDAGEKIQKNKKCLNCGEIMLYSEWETISLNPTLFMWKKMKYCCARCGVAYRDKKHQDMKNKAVR